MTKGNKIFLILALVWCIFMGCFIYFNMHHKERETSKTPTTVVTYPLETMEPIEIETTVDEEEMKWIKRTEEYPEATQTWIYMKENFEWSDEVCAGILGNIMAEIGGGTLDFSDWNHDSPYGMFQWLGNRKIELKKIYGDEPTIEEQLEFMYDELYGTDGVTKQVSDWQREKILTSTDPKQVAKYFCTWFERPSSSGTIRQKYAAHAYSYFTD